MLNNKNKLSLTAAREQKMLEQIKTLVKQGHTCVLATAADGKPYCSLMAYVADKPCEEIYMVTHINTRKYDNLLQNPAVSIMIDTRETKPRTEAQALTVEGTFCQIDNEKKQEQVRSLLLKTHPHLKQFMDHHEAALLCFKIQSFLLLNGLVDSHFIKLEQ